MKVTNCLVIIALTFVLGAMAIVPMYFASQSESQPAVEYNCSDTDIEKVNELTNACFLESGFNKTEYARAKIAKQQCFDTSVRLMCEKKQVSENTNGEKQ